MTDIPAPEGARRAGLLLGPLAFALILVAPVPEGLTPIGLRTGAVVALMAIWWVTEAVPIPVTALLPLALFPLLGILDMAATAAPFANELIFLFMGGFFIAAAMERSGLHRRVALAIVHAIGTSPSRLVLGFMLATAFLSMWISNTATATMMLPIAIAVAEMLKPADRVGPYEFGIALMLGIAYGASIGGISTLIGTPPNAILAAAAQEVLGIQIGFGEWMLVGLPVAIVMLPLTWLALVKVLYPPRDLVGGADDLIRQERTRLGPVSRAERIVGVVFLATALAWIFRTPKDLGSVVIPGITSFAPWVQDSTIAMAAALLLFSIPLDLRKGEFILDWSAGRRIAWGVLILFGGGLSLARAMEQSGLAAWIGSFVTVLDTVPHWVLIVGVVTLVVFLTEITSNAATTTMAMPIMAGAGLALGVPPMMLMTTAALAASMAFMLPVATPPNAIVFSSGYLTIPQMVRAGLLLNLIAIVVVTLVGLFLVPRFLLPGMP
ncbi:MAG: DASS family sodium-coupled anion symporter [Gemmatimonadota bacterium]|nr:DASS family sodium-coupled anion symporter [Gemmatimonadota bacterium]